MKTMQEQLIEKGLSAPEKDGEKKEIRPKETLSRKDWESVMGMNRPTYQKQNGKTRRKR